MTVNHKIRKACNRLLQEIRYSMSVGVAYIDICNILLVHDLQCIQEDSTPFEGIFCGSEGNAKIDLQSIAYGINYDSMLILSWYRMSSGRYEINTYIS